jgi:hypothetical protein
MAPRRKPGLDAETIAGLQTRLAEGKRPRVTLIDPSFPAGTTGSVVRVGDPTTDGADYITVRVAVNGATDELPFSPGELELPGRKASPAKATRSRLAPTKAAAARAAATSPPPMTPSTTTPSTTVQSASAPTPPPAPSLPPTSTAPAAPSTGPTPAKSGPARARKKQPAPPKVAISLVSTGASWTISATRGAKSIAKATAVPPGVITAVAALLDQPAVTEAVAEVNETALAEAQQRAAVLRAELAELDAVLAAHRAPA